MVDYRVSIENENGVIHLTKMFNNEKDITTITEDVHHLKDMMNHFDWREPGASQSIGKTLFTILDGTNSLLKRALKEANDHGEPLQLYIQIKGDVPHLPFELLYDSHFLVPFTMHVIHQVSNYGYKRTVTLKNRPLKILFMACSPEGVEPVLDFEKEEEIILEICKSFAVDIDVEDTGSLQGLKECLAHNTYDIVHISGHADIKDNTPYFLMEDEIGHVDMVTPAAVWDALTLSPPRLLFLSGCKTGESPQHEAAVSFAHELVEKHSSTVLGWGLPVTDPGATAAAARVYFELSRGKSILDAVFSARQELYNNAWPDWCVLRLFSDGTPLSPLVQKGLKVKAKARDIQYTCLHHNQVKVLTKGFVGRRRQIQRGIKTLTNDQKYGVVLHGTGGLGKSCLAGKLCERFKGHTLLVVHGKLNEFTFFEAVKDAFIRSGDKEGLDILQGQEALPDKIRMLCATSFLHTEYLIVLDDFEKNLEGVTQGDILVSADAFPIMETLLQYLPYAVKKTQLIITSRYLFSLVKEGRDLVKERLELIGLTSFQGADEQKKVAALVYIDGYDDRTVRRHLIEAGRGNPRLMEVLNALVKEKGVDESLLQSVEGKKEEFVQELVLKEILKSQSELFQKVLQYQSVYRVPVLKGGIEQVVKGITGWDSFVDRGVQLSLIEEGRDEAAYYWVTPLLREEIFEKLSADEQVMCHNSAVTYYQHRLSAHFVPGYALELIEHALQCGMHEAAIETGGVLLPYLRENLLYTEALYVGVTILSHTPGSAFKRDEKSSRFFYEFGWILKDVGDPQKAVKYYEKALEIDREVYGENHPKVAATLNNLGMAWNALGNPQKAVDYLEKALKIVRKVYGENHPEVATRLNNLGMAWHDLGNPQKAVDYFEKALKIDRKVYGENHPNVATDLNNLGSAWHDLGNPQKAVDYYEKALKIDRKVYGENHPEVATDLNNLGSAWHDLGNPQKAIDYLEKALEIDREVYGENHPTVATRLNNLGMAWHALGNPQKAVDYYEKALEIVRKVYGENHPKVATRLNNLGMAWHDLGNPQKAVDYFEKALKIDRKVYGENHPKVATRLNNLGMAWNALGNPQKAVDYFEKALSIIIRVYGENHPNTATMIGNLGMAWLSLKNLKKALECIQKSYTIFQKIYGDTHPDTRAAKKMLEALKNV